MLFFCIWFSLVCLRRFTFPHPPSYVGGYTSICVFRLKFIADGNWKYSPATKCYRLMPSQEYCSIVWTEVATGSENSNVFQASSSIYSYIIHTKICIYVAFTQIQRKIIVIMIILFPRQHAVVLKWKTCISTSRCQHHLSYIHENAQLNWSTHST